VSLRVAVTCGKPSGAARYADALRELGLEPVTVAPPEQRSLAQIRVDGLMLGGGTDIDAALYGQERARESDPPDQARDRMEARLLRDALRQDFPVFGVCRGMQFLNVYHGGTLVQHLKNSAIHTVRTGDRSSPAHTVLVKPGTRLERIIGAGRCLVNSRHHQGVERVPGRLVVAARSPDGVVEALERHDRSFVLGVQWHPEDQLNDRRQRGMFEAFREAVEKRTGS
jgi:putative glutamine amidotransferase